MELHDIKKLANLARIDMSEDEMKELAKDFEPILAYVSQVKEALNLKPTGQDEDHSSQNKKEDHFLYNIMREDIVTNKTGEYTEKIVGQMPDTQDGYLKVKQIL